MQTPQPTVNYKLTIPAVPASGNVLLRTHWAQRKLILDEWDRMVWALGKEAGLPNMDACIISATVYFSTSRKRDADNFEYGLKKILQDSLVRCGFLPDDSPEQITWGCVALLVDRDNPRTEVTISM